MARRVIKSSAISEPVVFPDLNLAWAQLDQLKQVDPVEELKVGRLFEEFSKCSKCDEYRVFVDYEYDNYVLTGDYAVCPSCGGCDPQYISDRPDWSSGMDADGEVCDNSRVGAPTNTDHFSDSWNLGTNMKVKTQTRMSRIDFYLSINYKDRALYLAYQEMEQINKSKLYLPESVMYLAKMKYRKFVENVLTRGTVRTGIKANAIFQACKEVGINRTSKEIADAFGIDQRDISRTTEMFKEQNPEASSSKMTMPKDLIARFFNKIEEDRRVKMKCFNVCEKLEDCVKLQGRTPKAVACAVIFVILNGKLSKKQVCEICEVSQPTLSKLEPIVREEICIKLKINL